MHTGTFLCQQDHLNEPYRGRGRWKQQLEDNKSPVLKELEKTVIEVVTTTRMSSNGEESTKQDGDIYGVDAKEQLCCFVGFVLNPSLLGSNFTFFYTLELSDCSHDSFRLTQTFINIKLKEVRYLRQCCAPSRKAFGKR